MVDELAEIGEAGRDVGVVAGGIAGIRDPSSRRRVPAAAVVDGERPRVGNIRPNMPGSSCPESESRNYRVGCRPAAPWPGWMFTSGYHHFLQSDVGRRGVPVCRDVRSLKVQENPIDTPRKGFSQQNPSADC